jgi:hypothetical protein
VDFSFRLFIYGLIEREKLITNIYILFRFDRYLTEKNVKQVERLQMSYMQLKLVSFIEIVKFQGHLFC